MTDRPKNLMMRVSMSIFSVSLLAGCGLRLPEITETGDQVDVQRFIQAIVFNINCELRDAFADLRHEHPRGTFLDSWAAQTTLTLTYDETTSISPNVLGNPAPAIGIFTLTGGLAYSSEAIRTETTNGYFLISDLEKGSCSSRPDGPYLLKSDLGLSQWIRAVMSTSDTRSINYNFVAAANVNNAIQHELKFIITTNGSVNPTWTLSRITLNPSGNFLSMGRVRTNDLLITLGPAAPAVVSLDKRGNRVVTYGLNQQAENLHFAATIANGINNALMNNITTGGFFIH